MSIEPDRLIAAAAEPGETRHDYALRPHRLDEYVGQSAVKE
jgi:Holliday junction DNA helicase RuvB